MNPADVSVDSPSLLIQMHSKRGIRVHISNHRLHNYGSITSVDVSVDGGGFESVQIRCRVQERVQSDVGFPSGLQAAAGNVSG